MRRSRITSERNTLLCVAIEASGDRILASVLSRLDLTRWRPLGIGGTRAQRVGLKSMVDPSTLAAHGLTEALHVLPATLRAWRILRDLALDADAYLLVDAPELNVRLTRWVRSHASPQVRSRPILYIAPPQAWAWRAHRARHLRGVDVAYCLFEFAARWYRERGVNAHYIGHPLGDMTPNALAPAEAEMITLALFPGSRRSSVTRALPLMMLSAARAARTLKRSCRLQIAETAWVSPTLYQRLYRDIHRQLIHAGWAIDADGVYRVSEGNTATLTLILDPILSVDPKELPPHPALSGAQLTLCYAGTATLEVGLAGVAPLTVAPLSPLSAYIARALVKLDACALPNLILERRAFPELAPWESTEERLSALIIDLFTEPHTNPSPYPFNATSMFTDAIAELYDRVTPLNTQRILDDLDELSRF